MSLLTLLTHGAGKHTDVTRELFLPANEGYVYTGAPEENCCYAAVSGGSNLNEPEVYFTMKVPDDFASFVKVEAIWIGGGVADNMYWRMGATYGACGEAYDTDDERPDYGITTNGGAGILNCQEPANPLTLVNLALGDLLGLKFQRRGSDVLDTLDVTPFLFGLLFTYVANQ